MEENLVLLKETFQYKADLLPSVVLFSIKTTSLTRTPRPNFRTGYQVDMQLTAQRELQSEPI